MSFASWLRTLRRSLNRYPASLGRRNGARPSLERLEDRTVPSTFTVTNTLDDGSTGSLRWAINQANGDSDPASLINFHIASSGVQTIQVGSSSGAYSGQGLPTLNHPATIDGTTEGGYSGSPLIELNGTSVGAAVDGLYITGGNSTVRGLVINGFTGNGIFLSGGGNDKVVGNYIGTDSTGTHAVANAGYGITVSALSNTTVGGSSPGEGNLISGNGAGVRVSGNNNHIEGNLIGTDYSGTTTTDPGADGIYGTGDDRSLSNAHEGIHVNNATNLVIGVQVIDGTVTGARNIISGNSTGIYGLGSGSTVAGNYIGTDITGEVA